MSPASYNVWVAKPGNVTDYAVTRIGNKTNVRLGKASVRLLRCRLETVSRERRVVPSGSPAVHPTSSWTCA